jgi:cell division protein FtsL
MKKRNPRRGIAIEFAIGLMLLTVAFSMIMVTTSMLQTKKVRQDLADFKEKIEEMQKEDLADNESHTLVINGKEYTVTAGED